eukprot:12629388-Alexandrium_andersonii.AAC.1
MPFQAVLTECLALSGTFRCQLNAPRSADNCARLPDAAHCRLTRSQDGTVLPEACVHMSRHNLGVARSKLGAPVFVDSEPRRG